MDAPSVFRAAGAAVFEADAEAEGEAEGDVGTEALGVAVTLAVEDTEAETEGEGSPRPRSPAPVSPPAAQPAALSTNTMAAQGANPREPPAPTVSVRLTDAS
ncbi:hypothetical protein SAMN02745830_06206 [Streptomyces sp. Amel2xC10]|nr:hypothetical protein SAMN02745830_06206 [Streptomyces sp. Amel2xC10]